MPPLHWWSTSSNTRFFVPAHSECHKSLHFGMASKSTEALPLGFDRQPIFAHPQNKQKSKQPNNLKTTPQQSVENKEGVGEKKRKKIKEVVWNKGGNMKAADTGREPVTLSAMEQFVDDEMRIYQDPYASSIKKTKSLCFRALRS